MFVYFELFLMNKYYFFITSAQSLPSPIVFFDINITESALQIHTQKKDYPSDSPNIYSSIPLAIPTAILF